MLTRKKSARFLYVNKKKVKHFRDTPLKHYIDPRTNSASIVPSKIYFALYYIFEL